MPTFFLCTEGPYVNLSRSSLSSDCKIKLKTLVIATRLINESMERLIIIITIIIIIIIISIIIICILLPTEVSLTYQMQARLT